MGERESMSFDVVIVGAGIAGLSAAIRLKQLALEDGGELSVVVLEKGVEVGAHILSGAVIDPVGLDQLIPDWRERDAPLSTRIATSHLYYLGKRRRFEIPELLLPKIMRHENCYVGSLGALTRWLGEQAGQLGVEIYPGFGAAHLLFGKQGAVEGVATADQGLDGDGQPTARFMRGMELRGRYTLLAEGARGFLSQQLIKKYRLRQGRDMPKYALGLKELWQVPDAVHQPGRVEHYAGWPLAGGGRGSVSGGGFVYHYGKNLVAAGLVVHADYTDPGLSPFDLLQKFKTHRTLRPLFQSGKRTGYGARVISTGGWQSLPKLGFPGGALLGCAAGMVNGASMKGSHNAILSGRHAALSCFKALRAGRSHDEPCDYQASVVAGEIGVELRAVRNMKPLMSRAGVLAAGILGGVDLWTAGLLKRQLPVTLSHKGADRAALKRGGGRGSEPVVADGIVTFDKSSSLQLSGVFHDDSQPPHLTFREACRQLENSRRFALEPAQFYCPAGVYELRSGQAEKQVVHITAANCLHCKMCDIKDPADNIIWGLPPSGGPTYVDM